MSKEWTELADWGADLSKIQVGDIVGVRGHRPGIYRVSRKSDSGQLTLVSTDPQSTEKPRRFLPRGRKVGTSYGFQNNGSWLTGANAVRQTARRCQYAHALYELHKFVESLYKAHDGQHSGWGYRDHNGTPITKEEYTELARLAKLCLDDGTDPDITRYSLDNSPMERARRKAAGKAEDGGDDE